MPPRLKAEVWVKAYIRRCHAAGKPAMLLKRGDEYGGSVLIKVDRLDGTGFVLSPSFGMDGGRLWLKATGKDPVEDAAAQTYIDKRLSRDPDIWVVEVEAPDGDPLLDEPIE